MKYLLLILGLCIFMDVQGQNDSIRWCGTEPPDSTQAMQFAYYANNEVLDSVLQMVGYYEWLEAMDTSSTGGKIKTHTHSDGYIFNVPVTIWDYHDDDGTNEAYPEQKLLEALEAVNKLYDQNHVGIHFFLACPILHVNSTKYNHLSGHAEFWQMTYARKNPMTLNWHMVSSAHAAGEAISPFLPQNYSFFVLGKHPDGDLGDIIHIIGAAAHEIGHTLGLLHTFHGGKLPWWDNEQIPWGLHVCFQEPADHSRINTPWMPCGIVGLPKCMQAGDFLCDTEATGGADYDGYPTCKRVKIIQDRWGDDFPTEPRNIMSYIDNECKQAFTTMQKGVMYVSLLMFPNNTYVLGNQVAWWLNSTHTQVSGISQNGDTDGVANYYITSPKPNHTYIAKEGAKVSFVVGNAIELNPGTEIQQGAIFSGDIDLFWACILEISSMGRMSKNQSNLSLNDSNNYEQIINMVEKSVIRRDSLLEQKKESSLTMATVSPNPFDETLRITLNRPLTSSAYLKIINTLGEVVYFRELSNQMEQEIYPNIKEQGVYYYIIIKEDKQEQGKIVKVK